VAPYIRTKSYGNTSLSIVAFVDGLELRRGNPSSGLIAAYSGKGRYLAGLIPHLGDGHTDEGRDSSGLRLRTMCGGQEVTRMAKLYAKATASFGFMVALILAGGAHWKVGP
jgi:hypothetical protein